MNRFVLFFCFVCFIPASLPAQGWEDITPPDLPQVWKFRSFQYADSSFEFYGWGDEKGYRFDQTLASDSILSYYVTWSGDFCYNDLIDFDISQSNPNLVVNIFVESGPCTNECFMHVYRSTSHLISNQNEVLFIDDWLCGGMASRIRFNPLDENQVYLTHMDSVYRSTDSGQSFQALSTPDPANEFNPWLFFLEINPHDPTILFVGGLDDDAGHQLYRSSDSGSTWTPVLVREVRSLAFHPAVTGTVAAASDSGIYQSTDGGLNWQRSLEGNFWSVTFDPQNPDTLLAGSQTGALFSTWDGGQSWSIFNDTFSSSRIHGLFKPRFEPWILAATVEGLFKVDSSFVLGLDNPVEFPRHFTLNQNYPNPFNPATVITYTLDQRAPVRLVVYNILGQPVQTLVDGFQPAGSHQISFDGKHLSSGVYAYRLTVGAKSETRKMLLIK